MNFWRIKWNGCLCNETVLNTGVPQGHVISSFLLSIYTNEIMRNNNGLVLIKRSDNTTQGTCLVLCKSQQQKKKKKEETTLQNWQIRLTNSTSKGRTEKRGEEPASSMPGTS